ncbi:MAG: hypothetical protein HDR77_01240 [Bacteroides sp.]|nr:hypothetical protein [Bacteroides sp.]
MKLSHDDKDYESVLRLLEPHHAPVTDMRFIPPVRRVPRWKKTLVRVSRLVAVLVVGVGIGLLFVHPDFTIAASKVIQLGMEKIRTSRVCRIELQVRMLPGADDALNKLSPKGEMHPVSLVYTSGVNTSSVKIDWNEQHRHYCLELTQGEKMIFNGKEVSGEILPPEAFTDIFETLYSGADGLSKVLNGNNVRMTVKNDRITLEHTTKMGTVKLVAVFSDTSGRLLSFKAYDTSTTPSLLMIETTSITYN